MHVHMIIRSAYTGHYSYSKKSILFLYSLCATHSHLSLWITQQTHAHVPAVTHLIAPTPLLHCSLGMWPLLQQQGPSARRWDIRALLHQQKDSFSLTAFPFCLISFRPPGTDGGKQKTLLYGNPNGVCKRLRMHPKLCMWVCAPVRGVGVGHHYLKVVVLFAVDLLYVLDKRAFSGNKTHTCFLSFSLPYTCTQTNELHMLKRPLVLYIAAYFLWSMMRAVQF